MNEGYPTWRENSLESFDFVAICTAEMYMQFHIHRTNNSTETPLCVAVGPAAKAFLLLQAQGFPLSMYCSYCFFGAHAYHDF